MIARELKFKSSIHKIIKLKFNIDLVFMKLWSFFFILLNIKKNRIMKDKKNQKLNHINNKNNHGNTGHFRRSS